MYQIFATEPGPEKTEFSKLIIPITNIPGASIWESQSAASNIISLIISGRQNLTGFTSH